MAGALLLAIIVLFVSCGGGDDSKKRGSGPASQAPTPSSSASSPEEEPSFSDAVPNGGPSLPDPEDLESPGNPNPGPGLDPSTGAGTTGNNANVTAPADGSCADQEMSVTPVPASPTTKRGTPLVIRLKIKNISARSCTRDLGAGAQELYLDQAARKYWSSDTCNPDRSTDARRMQPGGELEYTITWNGRQSSKCASAQPAGPAPPPGQYELRGRLGTKISEPAALTITD